LERESCDEIKNHPSTFEILYGNFLWLTNSLECFFILIFKKEIEHEINSKRDHNKEINHSHSFVLLCLIGYEENCCEAGITNDEEQRGIKILFPFTVAADDEVVYFNVFELFEKLF